MWSPPAPCFSFSFSLSLLTHHDTAQQADAPAAVSVGDDVPVAYAQKCNRYQPEAVQEVVVVVGVVVPGWRRQGGGG